MKVTITPDGMLIAPDYENEKFILQDLCDTIELQKRNPYFTIDGTINLKDNLTGADIWITKTIIP